MTKYFMDQAIIIDIIAILLSCSNQVYIFMLKLSSVFELLFYFIDFDDF